MDRTLYQTNDVAVGQGLLEAPDASFGDLPVSCTTIPQTRKPLEVLRAQMTVFAICPGDLQQRWQPPEDSVKKLP